MEEDKGKIIIKNSTNNSWIIRIRTMNNSNFNKGYIKLKKGEEKEISNVDNVLSFKVFNEKLKIKKE
jgi:hypothetical protein